MASRASFSLLWAASIAAGLSACAKQDAPAPAAEPVAAAEAEAAAPSEPAEVAIDLSAAPSGTYTSEAGHRYISFSYVHQGLSRPQLRWADWTGVLQWNLEAPESSSIDVTINVASIDTGVDRFDEHMKTADLFDVAQFPQATFKSTAVTRTGPNTGSIAGDLTIKGVTQPVVIEAQVYGAQFDQRGGKHKIGFSGKTALKRSDFNLGFAVPFVGDEVEIEIEAEFEMAAAAPEAPAQ